MSQIDFNTMCEAFLAVYSPVIQIWFWGEIAAGIMVGFMIGIILALRQVF